ncbi:MAG TPA: hypothetical protein VMT91_01620 [Anaerolineales bacterium]|nr:hypothetical protein [Anaerolineales bacterium]
MELACKSISLTEADSRSWAGLYRLSGIMLILTAVIWTVVSWTAQRLYSSGYPADPAAYLQLISLHLALASVTWSLWIVADFLLVAPTVALYIVLVRYNKTLALLGSILSMFFNIYDVSVTELNSLTLVSLAKGYAGATSEAAKAAFVGAAAYGYHGLPIQTVLSFAIGTLGYLLWCLAMWKGKELFLRWVTIFGAFWSGVGLLGSLAPMVPSSAILGLCQLLCVPMVGLWFAILGVRLFRYANRIPA